MTEKDEQIDNPCVKNGESDSPIFRFFEYRLEEIRLEEQERRISLMEAIMDRRRGGGMEPSGIGSIKLVEGSP